MTSSGKNVRAGLAIREKDLVPLSQEDSTGLARRQDAIIFLREFVKELAREISPVTKLCVLLVSIAIISGGIYLGRSAYTAYQAQQQKNLTLLDAQGKRIDEQGATLTTLKDVADRTRQQINALDKDSADLKQSNKEILDNLSLAANLWNSYNTGVCLIAGSYIFIEPGTGLPLRYPSQNLNDEERLLTTGTEVPLTPAGDGPVFELEFVGTGFHVGDGFIVTNSHVVSRPWVADMHAQLVIADTNARPQLKKLQAFFPGQSRAYGLKLKAASRTNDLAVCTLDQRGARTDIPSLPLEQNADAVTVGKPVVLMGYPTGPDRMLALLPEEEALGLQKRYGASLFVLLDELARRRLVKPLTTQGHVTDLYTGRIVYDAETGDGSSGAPLFGESGRVVGIAFAIFVENRASNFAVPVRSAVTLLKQAGWGAKKI